MTLHDVPSMHEPAAAGCMQSQVASSSSAIESLNMNVIAQESRRTALPAGLENGDSSACPEATCGPADVRDESKRVSHIPGEKRQSDLYSLLDGGARGARRKHAHMTSAKS